MKLHLFAESENNIGYTPDWIQVSYEENGKMYELNLDIQGDIDYDPKSLYCNVKGELIPWTLVELEDGDEIDLSEDTEKAEKFTHQKIAELFEKGTDFLVGIYPVDDANFYGDSIELNTGVGSVEIYIAEENKEFVKNFRFHMEVNI